MRPVRRLLLQWLPKRLPLTLRCVLACFAAGSDDVVLFTNTISFDAHVLQV